VACKIKLRVQVVVESYFLPDFFLLQSSLSSPAHYGLLSDLICHDAKPIPRVEDIRCSIVP